MRKILSTVLALTLGMSPSLGLSAWASSQNAQDWYILRTQGKDIGMVNVRSYNAPDGLITEVENVSHLTRKGTPFNAESRMRFVEAPDSFDPLGFRYNLMLGQQSVADAAGEVRDNYLDMGSHTEAVPIENNAFLFPAGRRIESLYSTHAEDAPGTRFTMQTLQLGASPQLVNTQVTVEGQEEVLDSAGQVKTVRKYALKNIQDKDESSLVYEWRDDAGKLYRALSHDGTEMVYAMQNTLGNASALDVVETSQIATNRIAYPRITYTGLYRISPLPGASQLNLNALIPQNRQQTFEKSDANGVFVRVKRNQPVNSQLTYPILYDDDYTRATPLLQADDYSIVNTAKSVVGKEKRAYYAVLKLQQWVNQNIANKSMDVAFASAAETMQAREGDCTEHAVLLAAMARSLGIPSRVAVGLVYMPENDSNSIGYFVYHMWTEIYLGDLRQGEWFPLDATFPDREMDATHIKLFDTSLNNPQDVTRVSSRVVRLLGGLRIDVLEALAQGQSVISLSDKPDAGVSIPKIDIQRVDIRAMTNSNISRFRVQPIDPELSLRSPEGLLSLGVQYLVNNQYEKAIQALTGVSGKIKDANGHYKYARQLLGLELYGMAAQEFQKASTLDASLREPVQGWMQVYLPRQRLSADLEKLYIEGINAESREEYADALAVFAELRDRAPQFAPLYLHIATVQMQDDEPEEALQAYQAYTRLAPADPRGPEGMALAYMKQQQYPQAAQAYRDAHALALNLSVPTARNKAKAMDAGVQIAQSYSKLAQNQKSAPAWLSLGKALYQQGNKTGAQKAFGNAAILSSSLLDARLWQFKVMLENGEWQELGPLYQNTVSRASSPMARTLKGQYEMRIREYEKAESTLKQAIAANPSDEQNYDLLGQVYRRNAELSYQKKSRYSKEQYQALAAETLQKGITRVSSAEGKNLLRRQLANLLMDSDPAAADGIAAEVLASTNTRHDPSVLTLKGKTAFAAGNTAEAERMLKQALAQNSFDVDALKMLGDLYRAQARVSQSLYYYQEALAADPENPVVGNALYQLIEENHLSVKKPTRYWILSDDERDYTIQLLADTVALYDGKIKFYNRITPVFDENLGAMTVASNLVRPEMKQIVDERFNELLANYEKKLKIIPPRRFLAVHQSLLSVYYSSVRLSQHMSEHLPIATFYESRTRLEGRREAYKSIVTETASSLVSFVQANSALAQHVPASEVMRWRVESGGSLSDKQAQAKLAEENFLKKYISVMEKAEKQSGGGR